MPTRVEVQGVIFRGSVLVVDEAAGDNKATWIPVTYTLRKSKNILRKLKFDLDALRDAAYGRYLVGPLKLPTLSRLSDRLVKQFREKVSK